MGVFLAPKLEAGQIISDPDTSKRQKPITPAFSFKKAPGADDFRLLTA
jgi:hypothetical protein